MPVPPRIPLAGFFRACKGDYPGSCSVLSVVCSLYVAMESTNVGATVACLLCKDSGMESGTESVAGVGLVYGLCLSRHMATACVLECARSHTTFAPSSTVCWLCRLGHRYG